MSGKNPNAMIIRINQSPESFLALLKSPRLIAMITFTPKYKAVAVTHNEARDIQNPESNPKFSKNVFNVLAIILSLN